MILRNLDTERELELELELLGLVTTNPKDSPGRTKSIREASANVDM